MISCKWCIERAATLKASGQRADAVYAVGNPAKPDMGHDMYFAADGRTALCIAKPAATTADR